MTVATEPWDAGPDDVDPRMDEVTEDIAKQNVIYIKGIAYELASYGEPHEDGSRRATLRLWKPF